MGQGPTNSSADVQPLGTVTGWCKNRGQLEWTDVFYRIAEQKRPTKRSNCPSGEVEGETRSESDARCFYFTCLNRKKKTVLGTDHQKTFPTADIFEKMHVLNSGVSLLRIDKWWNRHQQDSERESKQAIPISALMPETNSLTVELCWTGTSNTKIIRTAVSSGCSVIFLSAANASFLFLMFVRPRRPSNKNGPTEDGNTKAARRSRTSKFLGSVDSFDTKKNGWVMLGGAKQLEGTGDFWNHREITTHNINNLKP